MEKIRCHVQYCKNNCDGYCKFEDPFIEAIACDGMNVVVLCCSKYEKKVV